jgi:hypothetical protein
MTCYGYVRRSDDEELRLQTLMDDQDAQSSKSPSENDIEPVPINPNLVLVFLNRVLEVLEDYFALSPFQIEANYDVMCNLMQEMIQGGAPYITDINALRDIVSFKSSWGSKILSSTNQLAKTYSSSPTTVTNGVKVPWRRPNVKYTNNELFVDITEHINVVLSPRIPKQTNKIQQHTGLFTKIAVLEGAVDFTSHLSGTPYIALNLSLNGHHLGNPAFHRCVRVDLWASNEGLLSFIPPDGKTTVMKYTIALDSYPASKAQRNFGIVIPEYRYGLGVKKNEFEVSVKISMLRSVTKVENLKLQLVTEQGQSVKTLRLSHGDFQTKSQGLFEWVFDNDTPMGINAVLRGIVEDPESEENINWPKSIALDYSLKGSLPSGIRVGSVKVTGLDVKPYKGVKYITKTGDFVIR